MSAVRIGGIAPPVVLADCLRDAEREVAKLRGLLVKQLCTCRALAVTLPLEPVMHKAECEYRRAMQ